MNYTLRTRWLDRLLTRLQDQVGARWILASVSNLLSVHGLENVAAYKNTSMLLVANHRSFFDMFVLNAILYRRAGYDQRFLFPVRSSFFYDRSLGFLVNAIVSFFSMYPPVFRDRKRALLNHQGFIELSEAMRSQTRSAGIHPEGTRNIGDPYALLPAQSGAGRLVHLSGRPVIPAFINGLTNSIPSQIAGNIRRTGEPVIAVFGPAVPLDDLLAQPGSGRVYRAIAERIMERITELAEKERALREAE